MVGEQIGEQRMGQLNKRLNWLFDKPVTGSLKAKHGEKEKRDMAKYTWSNTAFIINLLAPAIEKYTPEPGQGKARESLKLKIMNWVEFKAIIFEIYDHRIQHAPEVQGMLNTNYMTMDEHMAVYFLEKTRTRTKLEPALIEFLAALKYYANTWERASTYAQMAGFKQHNTTFLHVADRTGTGMRLNDGELDEVDVPYIDMYLIEFALHAYTLIRKEQKSFVESQEGYTYLRQ